MQASKTRGNLTQTLASTLGSSATHGQGEDTIQSLRGKLALIEKDLERRQESYVVRERAFKARIEELESEIASSRDKKTGWMKENEQMKKLKAAQKLIIENVELVQDRTSKVLQEQERDLLRAFRARLFDVQTELEKEKSKKEDGASAWMERSRQLEAELEWTKEVADRLERTNQALLQENNRLKSQFKSQEEDRAFLIKQLVTIKKDNAKLRNEYVALEEENGQLRLTEATQGVGPASPEGNSPKRQAQIGNKPPGGGGFGGEPEMDERYKEINKRLRRLLAEERKSLQQVRQNYAIELNARTEMELLLRKCVEDVRKEIARRHIEATAIAGSDLVKLYSKNPGAIPIEDFHQEDRERALELLLSQERVITLLYAKTFPVVNKTSGFVDRPATDDSVVADNFNAAAQVLEASRPLTGQNDSGGSTPALPNINQRPNTSE